MTLSSLLRVSGSIMLTLTAMTACTGEAASPAAPVARQASPLVSQTGQPSLSTDEISLNADREMQGGFGGVVRRGGKYYVWLRDMSKSGAARAAFASMATGQDRLVDEADVVILPGDYTWTELHTWYYTLRDAVWSHAAVVSTDLDEETNRITIGIDDLGAAVELRGLIGGLGVPVDAVRFERESAPVAFAGTLQDTVRPVLGGYQTSIGLKGACTIGFNVRFIPSSGGTAYGFITAAHCTNTPGAVGGDVAYQPTASGANRIGQEERDPPRFTGGSCPVTYSCRWSDAALIRYDSPSLLTHGFIERTLLNSIVVDAGNPDWEILWDDNGCFTFGCAIITGDPVEKVGRTTGWTSGKIVDTCKDVAGQQWPPQTLLLCQDWVGQVAGTPTPIAGPSDSGAAVFRRSGCCSAKLYGIVVGGNDLNAATRYFLSRARLIRDKDLGWFTAIAPPVVE